MTATDVTLTGTTPTETSQQIALRWATEGFKDRALRRELMTPDYIQHFCGASQPMQGREVVNQFVDGTLHTGFPDIQQVVEDAFVQADKVALRITYRGTHQGYFLGIPPTQRCIAVSANMILRIADGKVAEEWTESNPLTWMQQLGAMDWLGQLAG
ncbi:MAG: ester cyclase [Cyanobacteria bacterium P01_A01_bin.114]